MKKMIIPIKTKFIYFLPMNIPKLKKIESEKKYHDIVIKDNYSWVDQPNILEVLKRSLVQKSHLKQKP